MMEISIASRCHLETQGSFFSNISRTIGQEHNHKLPHNVAAHGSRWGFHRLASSYQYLPPSEYPRRPCVCRTYSRTSRLEESASLQSGNHFSEDENPSTDSEEETSSPPCTTEQIMALLVDTERSKLTKKLSEANQQNRFLKRQLYIKEEALSKFKSELAAMELEVQALARVAEEIAQSGIPQGARKINGKYIHSHLVARLQGVHEQLKEQIKDVDAAQSKQISVFWVGMAESVQVMGSFDGWSQGEHLSPEYTSSYTRFSTTLMLRPGSFIWVGVKIKIQSMKKSGVDKNSNRFLISINFLGSSGPVRFVVNMKDLVSRVIESALKYYAREERVPVMGFDATNFLLYPTNACYDALNPLEPIGSYGGRNFVLCKKKVFSTMTEPQSKLMSQKSNGGWKAWLNKSFSFKVLSH